MKIEFLDMIFEVCLVDLKADFFLAKFLFFGFRVAKSFINLHFLHWGNANQV